MAGYGLIGMRPRESLLPAAHSLLGAYSYEAAALTLEEIPAFLRECDWPGFDVADEYGEAIAPYMAALSPAARLAGCVDVAVRLPDGGYRGDNAGVCGFLRLLDDGTPLAGRSALVLGEGRLARTARAALCRAGCRLSAGDGAEAEWIVNTSLDGDEIDFAAFPRLALAVDARCQPIRTPFLLRAEAFGVPCRNGLLALTARAERSAALCGLLAPNDRAAEEAARSLLRRVRNVAFIGMPGCGKTTVGRALARLAGRPFVDTDEEIEARVGLSIPEIFATRGEAAFREIETRVLREAAARSGVVIATGGGVVTVPENRAILRGNCAVALLTCPLSALSREGRPLSESLGVEALYRARKHLYEAWGEKKYACADAEAAARRILADWL